RFSKELIRSYECSDSRTFYYRKRGSRRTLGKSVFFLFFLFLIFICGEILWEKKCKRRCKVNFPFRLASSRLCVKNSRYSSQPASCIIRYTRFIGSPTTFQ